MLTASVGRPEVPKGQEEIKLQMANFFFFSFSFNPVLLWRHLAPPELNFISDLELTNAFFSWKYLS